MGRNEGGRGEGIDGGVGVAVAIAVAVAGALARVVRLVLVPRPFWVFMLKLRWT